jgi:hypothetical protein
VPVGLVVGAPIVSFLNTIVSNTSSVALTSSSIRSVLTSTGALMMIRRIVDESSTTRKRIDGSVERAVAWFNRAQAVWPGNRHWGR